MQIPVRLPSDSSPLPLRVLSDSSQIPFRFLSDSFQIPLRFPSDSFQIPFRFLSDSAQIPLRFLRFLADSFQIPFRRPQEGPRRPKMRQDVNILIFHRLLNVFGRIKTKNVDFSLVFKAFGENDNKNSGKRRTDRTSDAPNCSHRRFAFFEVPVAAV